MRSIQWSGKQRLGVIQLLFLYCWNVYFQILGWLSVLGLSMFFVIFLNVGLKQIQTSQRQTMVALKCKLTDFSPTIWWAKTTYFTTQTQFTLFLSSSNCFFLVIAQYDTRCWCNVLFLLFIFVVLSVFIVLGTCETSLIKGVGVTWVWIQSFLKAFCKQGKWIKRGIFFPLLFG